MMIRINICMMVRINKNLTNLWAICCLRVCVSVCACVRKYLANSLFENWSFGQNIDWIYYDITLYLIGDDPYLVQTIDFAIWFSKHIMEFGLQVEQL